MASDSRRRSDHVIRHVWCCDCGPCNAEVKPQSLAERIKQQRKLNGLD